MPTAIKKQQSSRKLLPNRVYRTKIDSKHRIVLRSAKYEYYDVYEREDGSAIIVPQVIQDAQLHSDTLRMIDSAIKNIKRGAVSERIALDSFLPKKRK